MIKSFQQKGSQEFYKTGSTRGIIASHKKRLKRILFLSDTAKSIEALNVPGFRLHKLKGDLQEFWAITVNANWRIIFRFVGEELNY